MKHKLVCLVLLGLLGFASRAEALPITFSEFPLGTTITNQYAPQGVLFSAVSFLAPITSLNGAVPTAPVLRPDGGPGTFEGDFLMTFPNPVATLSFDSGFWNTVGTAVINLFDPSNNLILAATNTITGVETHNFSGLGPIGSVLFDSVNDPFGADIDNLTFVAVPEPATLLLVGSGLVAVAGIARRRSHRRK